MVKLGPEAWRNVVFHSFGLFKHAESSNCIRHLCPVAHDCRLSRAMDVEVTRKKRLHSHGLIFFLANFADVRIF